MTEHRDNREGAIESLQAMLDINTSTVEQGIDMLVAGGIDRERATKMVGSLADAWRNEVTPLLQEIAEYSEKEDVDEEEAKAVFRKIGNSPLVLSAIAETGAFFVPGTMKIVEVTEDKHGIRIVDIVSNSHDEEDPVISIPIHYQEIEPLVERMLALKDELVDESQDEARENISEFFRELGVEL